MNERYSITSFYDSPIEERLAFFMESYLHPFICWDYIPLNSFINDVVVQDKHLRAKLYKQFEIKTRCASFRIDFVAESPNGQRIGLECDGRDFHLDKHRDHLRDAMILDTEQVSAIYRFSGEDITNWCPDVLRFILKQHSYFFPDIDNSLRACLEKSHAMSETNVQETPMGISEVGEYANKGDFEESVKEVETCDYEMDEETGRMKMKHRVRQVHSMEFIPSRTSIITRSIHFLAPHATKINSLIALARQHPEMNFATLLEASRGVT